MKITYPLLLSMRHAPRLYASVFSLLCAFSSQVAHAAPVEYLVNQSTFLKSTTGQASLLSASAKCELADRTIVVAESSRIEGVHTYVSRSNSIVGCGLKAGYLYTPHLHTASTSFTVHTPTLLKRSTLQSSQLGANDKCSMPAGVYPLTQAAGQTAGHYSVSLKNSNLDCGFTTGYVYTGHANNAIQGVGISATTIFKKRPVSSSSLSSSEVCTLQKGSVALKNPNITAEDNHHRVSLASGQSGCGFSDGYLWYQHVTLAPPEQGSDWFFPMPDAIIGSAWCQCRNIGTSPHIGQDVYKFGGMNAYTTQKGFIEDISFSSSCGYIAIVQDDFGGRWRYVHLNKPVVSEGQRVNIGQNLGSLSAYPRSGCGSGAHLHFERRSSGAFGDSATGKSCQNGFRSCYYDPMKPWRSGGGIKTTTINGPYGASEQYAGFCKVDKRSYRPFNERRLARFEVSNALEASVAIIAEGEEPVITARASLTGNPDNLCRTGDCARSWTLIVETTSGEWKRIFHDNSVANQLLVRETAEQFCLPDELSGNYQVLLRTRQGKRLRQEGRLF